MERKTYLRTCILITILVFTMFSIHAAQNFQAQWGNQTIPPETWTQINLTTQFEEPIVVATPEYITTTNDNGIMVWVTNVTNTSFMVRTSDENFNAQDSIMIHFLVMEKGAWILPGSGIKIEAGEVSTTKYGYQSNYDYCPADGETVTFTNSFDNNPLVLSTRTSNNNPTVFGTTIQSDVSSPSTVPTTGMCIGLSRSRSGAATFTNPEKLHWIAMDEGNGTLGGVEYEILWNLQDTGDSSGNWINGYDDPKPFTQSWAHIWTGAPNVIIAGQTSIGGGDGSWPVIYDAGNTGSIRMFVDESNERAHGGSESGGGFAFSSPGNVSAPAQLTWDSNNLHVGDPTINEGNESNTINFYSYKSNNNIQLNCISGNCSQFSDDWVDGSNALAFTTNTINFTCQDNPIGIYNATFRITSNEDAAGDLLNVTCQVFKVFADLSVTMLSPNPSIDLQISQNRTFTLQARVDCIGDPGTTCANVTGSARYNAISLYGDGSDGELIASSTNTIINDYTYLTGDELTGQTVLTVNDATNFNSDDEILIIQMQNGSGSGVAGQYEFAQIVSISGNDITLSSAINNSYYSGIFDSTNAQNTQVVRIPQYTNLTINSGSSITASAWNGYSGGIVIFRSQEFVNLNGFVNVSQKGFRGGTCGLCGNNDWGTQGESYLGIGTGVLTNNGNGGGGGFGPTGLGGEPGAGGGHATAGGIGDSTNDATGGTIIGSIDLNKLFFGGGGGAGGDNDNLAPFPQNTDGGGIVIIFSPDINNARIESGGEDAIGSSGAGGVAGAGAGGTIWLAGEEIQLTDVTAQGGASYNDGDDLGGAGGNGRIRIDYDTLSGSSTPAIGYSGNVTLGNKIMDLISTVSGNKPLWTSSLNPQTCGILNESDSCILIWTINATGDVNTSHLVDVIFSSNIIKVKEKMTQNLTINITANVIPLFTLISPNDNLKFIGGGDLTFNWTVSDDDSWLNCSFYINDIFNRSLNCSTLGQNNLTLNFERGNYNWTIIANDSDSNSGISPTWSFTLIKNSSSFIEKSIKFESLNLYRIEILVKALNPLTLIEWVVSDFMSGSQSPLSSWTNFTSSGEYIGWDNISNSSINHSISGVGDYKTRESYIIGLD